MDCFALLAMTFVVIPSHCEEHSDEVATQRAPKAFAFAKNEQLRKWTAKHSRICTCAEVSKKQIQSSKRRFILKQSIPPQQEKPHTNGIAVHECSDLIVSQHVSLSLSWRFFKRMLDIIGALLALFFLAPIFPFIALAIRLDSPGPVFFRQVRVGRNDKLFHIIKFRSMHDDAEKDTGAVWASEYDPRITRIGSFLRNTRMDELPQLINVLHGDMSLVGPRPERPELIEKLKKSIPFYSKRHSIRPGMTGWAQVRYPYGASVEDALEKLRYDLYYIKKNTVLFDIEIVLRTILIIFTGNGAR